MTRNQNRLSQCETVDAINSYASSRVPFVFLISFSGERNLVIPCEAAASSGFYIDMPGIRNHSFDAGVAHKLELSRLPIEPSRYRKAFMHVIEQIHYGNSFLLNLTFPTRVFINSNLQQIFAGSRAPFKIYLEDELVVFSPERFIKIRGNQISSNPMKGTIDAGIPGAHAMLTSDPKEDAEHNTIVDLIRNDLSTIADNVRVKRFKYIEKLKTHQGELLQMSSEIEGRLPEDYHKTLGQMIFKLLPAGSICGAPKKKTVEIIRDVEGYERGYYTGVFGHFDGTNLDSAVAIRYMEQQGEDLIFKSGGGITFQSQWQKEYDELLKKVYVPIY